MNMNMMMQRNTNFMKRLPKLLLPNNNNLKTLSFSSKSNSQEDNEIHNENPDVVDVTSAELKSQIDRFYKGDFEAIPTIFESILKRKLSGKHQDSDDELMNELLTRDVRDEEFGSDSNSDTDSESDK